MSEELKIWIGEIPVRAVKVVAVKARTYKEAQAKLVTGEDVEGITIEFGDPFKGRIICEDGSWMKTKKKNI